MTDTAFYWKKDIANEYTDSAPCTLFISHPINDGFAIDTGASFKLNTQSSLKLTCDVGGKEIYWNGDVTLVKGTLELDGGPSNPKGTALIIPAAIGVTDNRPLFYSSARFNFEGWVLLLGTTTSPTVTDFIFTTNSATIIKIATYQCDNARVVMNDNAFMLITTNDFGVGINAQYSVTDRATLHTVFNRFSTTATGKGYTLGGDAPPGQKEISPFINFACTNAETSICWLEELPTGFFNISTQSQGNHINNNGMFMISFTGTDEAFVQTTVNNMVTKGIFTVNDAPQGLSFFDIRVHPSFFTLALRSPDALTIDV